MGLLGLQMCFYNSHKGQADDCFGKEIQAKDMLKYCIKNYKNQAVNTGTGNELL